MAGENEPGQSNTSQGSVLRIIKNNKTSIFVGFLLLLVPVVIYISHVLYPILMTFVLSFTSWDILFPAKFIGLDNYKAILGDELFWKYLNNTVWLSASVIPFLLAGSILFFHLSKKDTDLSAGKTSSARILLSVGAASFLPVILALLGRWILNPDFGILNSILRGLGIHSVPMWLSSTFWSKPALAMIILSYSLSLFCLTAIVAGSAIARNPESKRSKFIWPIFIFVISILIIVSVTGRLDPMYVATQGGPAGSTTTLGYYIYNNAFQWFKLGYASALAIPGIILLLLCGFILWKMILQSRLSCGLIEPDIAQVKSGNIKLTSLALLVVLPLIVIFLWGAASSIKGLGGLYIRPPSLLPIGHKIIQSGKNLYYLSALSNSSGIQTVAILQKDDDERFIVAPINASDIIDLTRKQNVTQKQLHPIIEFKAHWENYLDVFTALDWRRHLLNSILYGLFGALQAILFGGLIAFALQFLIRPILPKISNLIFLLFILTIFISPQTYLMGAFPLIHKSGLIDTVASMTWQYSCSAPVLLLFYLYFEGQKTLASKAFPADKTGYLRFILRGIPTLLLGICTIFMLAGMSSFLWDLILTNSAKNKNAMVAIASFQGLYSAHWGFLCAAATTIWSFSLLVFTPLFILLEFVLFKKLIILRAEGETHV